MGKKRGQGRTRDEDVGGVNEGLADDLEWASGASALPFPVYRRAWHNPVTPLREPLRTLTCLPTSPDQTLHFRLGFSCARFSTNEPMTINPIRPCN